MLALLTASVAAEVTTKDNAAAPAGKAGKTEKAKKKVWGMWLCGGGVAVMPLLGSSTGLALARALSGFGMALLYPNLSAAVADIAHPDWRGSAIGIYRFWRDFGYAVGALLLGVAAAVAGSLEITFWLVGGAMFASGLLVRLFSDETLPPLNPALD